MVKKLFGASFEESKKIAYNLFKEKKWYDTGAEGSQNIGARIFNIVPWITFSVISYAIGVGGAISAKAGVTADKAEAKFKLGPFGLGLSIGG